MEILYVTEDGFELAQWNGERKGQHKLKKYDDHVDVINRETKEVVFSGKTVTEAEQFFWDREIVENILHHLRSECRIKPGITIADLKRIVDENEPLRTIAELCFGINYTTYINDPFYSIISRSYHIDKNNLLKTTYKFDCISGGEIVLDETSEFVDNNGISYYGDECYCLWDILSILFCSVADWSDCWLNKNGLQFAGTPIQALNAKCHVSDDVTLQDIFNFVQSNTLLSSFLSLYSWCWEIDKFHEFARTPPKEQTDLYQLVISDCGEINKKYLSFKGVLDFSGHGPLSKEEKEYYSENPDKTCPDYTTYAVEFTPVNQIAHLPVIIDEKFPIQDWRKTASISVIDTPRREYTLLQILDAIYYEISFLGSSPEEVEKQGGKMLGEMQEIIKKYEEEKDKKDEPFS